MAAPEDQWPTLAKRIQQARQGMLDERHLRVRPSIAEIERLAAEADAYLAYHAELEAREAADAETARPA
jgi:F0F1-type ATP synthase membrane subunit b/b'